ncbi:MAG: hypothetical protein UR56_C0026G0006 [Candidatus Roizmanbacteria bacterium GW2011_GWC2_34_23]|uniref:Uncharacterized protein n=1 Tax=Candidatus Roizmanbacteria bacterium GW2011_GWC2_34_23 TaxID=1618484 RepID=A0A0G0AT43_9BACT|nr:MAG: hypothetical protein UR56_C0026G0006 [Candidatus Roizmanbacteria bacterium GW2011_GWC2_34_23]
MYFKTEKAGHLIFFDLGTWLVHDFNKASLAATSSASFFEGAIPDPNILLLK